MYGNAVVTMVTLAIWGNGSKVVLLFAQRAHSAGTAHSAPPQYRHKYSGSQDGTRMQ